MEISNDSPKAEMEFFSVGNQGESPGLGVRIAEMECQLPHLENSTESFNLIFLIHN